MDIVKHTGTRNIYSLPKRNIKYLVIHYTAGATSRSGAAKNTAAYFSSSAQGSADYIVDETTLVQYNPDPKNYYCAAVGKDYGNSGSEFYGKVNNKNSISLEICSSNIHGRYTDNFADYYFTDAVITRAIEAAKYLMSLYNIDVNHVTTHFESRGKTCPGVSGWGAIGGSETWRWFKKQLVMEVNAMTKQDVAEFVQLCSDEQAFALLQKAMKFAGQQNEPDWSKSEGYWDRATAAGIINGKAPEAPIKRDEVVAILGRLEVL